MDESIEPVRRGRPASGAPPCAAVTVELAGAAAALIQ